MAIDPDQGIIRITWGNKMKIMYQVVAEGRVFYTLFDDKAGAKRLAKTMRAQGFTDAKVVVTDMSEVE